MNETVVEMTGLSKRYGKTLAVDGVNLEIPSGKVFALMQGFAQGILHGGKLLLGNADFVGALGRTDDPAGVLGRLGKRHHVRRQPLDRPHNHRIERQINETGRDH